MRRVDQELFSELIDLRSTLFLTHFCTAERLRSNLLSPNKRRGSVAVARCQETGANALSATRQPAPNWIMTIVQL